MKVESIDIDTLIPYARNAKLHNESQIKAIANSIEAFGFNNPVLIDNDNGIIAGHGRVLAAKKIGAEKVPCIRLGHLSDQEKRAYILADNRLQEMGGGWNIDNLKTEIDEIEFDLEFLKLDEINEDVDTDGIKKPTEIECRPYKKIHVLLSFDPSLYVDLQTDLEKIRSVEGVEYEQSAN